MKLKKSELLDIINSGKFNHLCNILGNVTDIEVDIYEDDDNLERIWIDFDSFGVKK